MPRSVLIPRVLPSRPASVHNVMLRARMARVAPGFFALLAISPSVRRGHYVGLASQPYTWGERQRGTATPTPRDFLIYNGSESGIFKSLLENRETGWILASKEGR